LSSVTCPYCWSRCKASDLHRRCGDRCGAKGTAFPARELKGDKCPHGNPPQARRFCPNAECGRDLLREYVETGGRTIAIIGSAGSGKSTWVGVMVHEFRGRVADRFPGMALDLLGEKSRTRYAEYFDEPLFHSGQTVRKTVSARATAPEPLMFCMKFRAQTKLLRTTKVTPVVTVFYDTAGEDVATADVMDQLVSYVEAAEGIILLIDPEQIPRVRESTGKSRTPRGKVTEQLHVINRLGELLRERTSTPVNRRLTTPLAIALTKLDLLRDTFDTQSPLRQPSRHNGSYHEDDGKDVHEEVRGWLDNWYGPSFDRSVASTFATYRYFGLSALGDAPVNDNQLSPVGVQPYRVEDPMLWLLGRFGAIKTTKGKQ
jgi:GTPase SAR1 family protein